MSVVAALYVDAAGIYANLEEVEVWGEHEDARRYEGPWPVVAHPPCKSWSIMGQCRPEIVRGDDGGCLTDPGWVCEVDQFKYGHRANKRTWLYYVGNTPPPMLNWGRGARSSITVRNDGGGGRDQRSRTPIAFRDVLLELARLSRVEVPA